MTQLRENWRALPTYARAGVYGFTWYVAANVIFGTEIGTPLWAAGLCTWFVTAVARIAWRERLASREAASFDAIVAAEWDSTLTDGIVKWDD